MLQEVEESSRPCDIQGREGLNKECLRDGVESVKVVPVTVSI